MYSNVRLERAICPDEGACKLLVSPWTSNAKSSLVHVVRCINASMMVRYSDSRRASVDFWFHLRGKDRQLGVK